MTEVPDDAVRAAVDGGMCRWVGPQICEDVARAVLAAVTEAGWTLHRGPTPAPPNPDDPAEARIRATIAASLHRAAAGRREYAASCTPGDEDHTLLTTSANCYDSTAQIIEDPSVVMAVIPSWRWTDEETASLYPPKENNPR